MESQGVSWVPAHVGVCMYYQKVIYEINYAALNHTPHGIGTQLEYAHTVANHKQLNTY